MTTVPPDVAHSFLKCILDYIKIERYIKNVNHIKLLLETVTRVAGFRFS